MLLAMEEIDVNVANEEGRTPLMKAVQWSNLEAVKVRIFLCFWDMDDNFYFRASALKIGNRVGLCLW